MKNLDKTIVPPIKIQGIKTKLVPFIMENIKWDSKGRWVEPFIGSGVVAINSPAKDFLVADTNIHLINFYKELYNKEITSVEIKSYLESEGKILLDTDGEHFYTVRERFNKFHSPYDFLFLSRACFNGIMRFNKKGHYNTPFCKKPDIFSQSLITKVVNQVKAVENKFSDSSWEFKIQDWTETLSEVNSDDFAYIDPPYIGTNDTYFGQWTEEQAQSLVDTLHSLPCNYGYSMWYSKPHRGVNEHITKNFTEEQIIKTEHYYHVGSKAEYRSSVVEALIVRD